jgi:hypothetical protein
LRAALRAELAAAKEPDAARASLAPSKHLYALFSLPLLLTAIWLGVNGGPAPESARPLAATVIAHIQKEEEHLMASGSLSRASLRRIFRALGASVHPDLGPVSFAGHCVIGEREGIHLVLNGERGAVTALFLPGRQTTEQRRVSGGGFVGTLVPVAVGVLAVVGQPGEPLEPIVRRLLVAVRWNEPKSKN